MHLCEYAVSGSKSHARVSIGSRVNSSVAPDEPSTRYLIGSRSADFENSVTTRRGSKEKTESREQKTFGSVDGQGLFACVPSQRRRLDLRIWVRPLCSRFSSPTSVKPSPLGSELSRKAAEQVIRPNPSALASDDRATATVAMTMARTVLLVGHHLR